MKKSVMFAAVAVLSAVTVSQSRAEDHASDADRAFVAKVSQGGRYEVEASKIAMDRADNSDIKNLATNEVHEHEKVNEKLKKISDETGIKIDKDLNAEFQERLEKLRKLPNDKFTVAYIEDMKQIHDKDERLFAKEAEEGSEAFKAFAKETDEIVKRHIGDLHATK